MRPGSAEGARQAMGGSPRIVMTPLHPRQGARGDGALGPPNREEQELREVSRQVAELAPQKFNTVREAFRYLRPDHNGRVSRSQVHYFFRAYGVERVQADRLFAYFDPTENDEIDCQKFIEFFRQEINPEDEPGPQVGAQVLQVGETHAASVCASIPGSPARAGPASGLDAAAVEHLCAKISNEFHYMLLEVREKAPQRFSHVREALRIVDVDYDGCITRTEMQHFFRAFGIEEVRADKFYEKLAKGGPGGANYHTFVQVVSPFLDLPGVVAHAQIAQSPSRPQSARSRPTSARSRPPSAEKRLPSAMRRPASPTAVDRKEILESALSGNAAPYLPALSRGGDSKAFESPLPERRSRPCTPTSARGRSGSQARVGRTELQELPLSARGRPCQQLSPRRNPSESRQNASGCDSPRQAASVCSNREPQQSLPPAHALPRQPSPQGTPRSISARRHLEHQLAVGNFQTQQLRDVFAPAAPPAPSGRPGRRPMGIQREAPVARKVGDIKDLQELGELKHNVAASTNEREALMSGGRPVATPSRRSGSRRGIPSE